jgi:hypothetical protein
MSKMPIHRSANGPGIDEGRRMIDDGRRKAGASSNHQLSIIHNQSLRRYEAVADERREAAVGRPGGNVDRALPAEQTASPA